MNEAIETAIQACEWSTAKFLIFSGNVFEPLIYYSHLGTLLIVLFFGLFIFFNNKKLLLNRILFYLTICISIWMFSDLVLWASEKPKEIMFFWTLEIIIEPLIYIISLYFFYVFLNKQDLDLKIKATLYSLLIPTLIFAPTTWGLTGFDLTNCDRVAIEGILPKYGYFLEILIVLWIIFLSFSYFYKSKDRNEKKQILLLSTGITLFLFSFSLGNIAEVISENWYIGQIGYIGIPIFMAFLSYQIVKFKTFNIKLLSSQVLVAAIWFLIVSLLFVRTVENIRVVVALTLALFSILGIYLIRSVKREVEQREKIERLAKDLERANEKLRELDHMKSEFLSLATHQIRSPLTAIKGYSSMMLDGDFGEFPVKARDAMRTIMNSSQNLISIVGEFLDISRIEQGRMVYNKENFEVGTLVKEVIKELLPNIQKAGLDINTDIPDSFTAKVLLDKGKIKQIIGNLVDNAIKYTPKGTITIRAENQGNKALIKIKDSGIGIEKEDIEKLFTKFTRTKDAFKTNVSGTGLGLYVAKKMMEAQGGNIKVESEGVGKGSTFVIEMNRIL